MPERNDPNAHAPVTDTGGPPANAGTPARDAADVRPSSKQVDEPEVGQPQVDRRQDDEAQRAETGGDQPRDDGAQGDEPDREQAEDMATSDRPAFSRFSRAQVLVGLLVAALGFAIVVQLRQAEQQGLASLRQSDLVRILDDVGGRRDRLAAEASDLESQRRELSDVRTGDQAALDAARARATTLGILAGTVAAKGPGIEVYITDPRATVRAATLLDLVQELRDAGAEAIQIESARVIASTSFTDVNGGVAVDNVMLRAPYTVRAIGDGQTMATALEIPGGVIASMPEGAHATVATREELEVTALHAIPQPQYARPAVTPAPAPSGS